MYQVRFLNGQTIAKETFEDLRASIGNRVLEIEKISFNGPDGTRIRLLARSGYNFALTRWMDSELTYVELGFES